MEMTEKPFDEIKFTSMPRVSTGDVEQWPQDFLHFYQSNIEAFIKLAFVIVQSVPVAQDIVQDAFISVNRRWVNIHSPLSYTRISIVNGCKKYLRRKRIEEIVLPRLAKREILEINQRSELEGIILTLPSREKIAIVLRYYADMSEKEIAEAVGCSVNTVPGLIARGVEKLRRKIIQDGI
ncbi:MAG: sigma-70 family RNA polymerase sigma factor [Acidimicrobiales bacterium]|nr:sigma-70 family RNA polymerase sigma factor [Acidimicrobiales bacterium]